MKSFKEIIFEAPFNDDQDYSSLNKTKDINGYYDGLDYEEYPDSKSNSPNIQMKDKFVKHFKVIGTGSSRTAFLAPINSHLFKARDIEELLVNDSNQVETVFKLAHNKKGLLQNKIELQIWTQLKKSTFSKFLCPIIDWQGNKEYGNDIQYTVDKWSFTGKGGKQTAPLWIQMPKCNFDYFTKIKLEKELFGEFTIGEVAESLTDQELTNSLNKKEITIEQYNNCLTFMSLCRYLNLSDIHDENVGVYNNKLVLVDYGFNDESSEVYAGRNSKEIIATFDKEGHVNIKIED